MGLFSKLRKTVNRGIGIGNNIKKVVGRGVAGARSIAKTANSINDKVTQVTGVNVGKAMYQKVDNAYGGGMVNKIQNAYKGANQLHRRVQGGDYSGAMNQVGNYAKSRGGKIHKNYQRGRSAYERGRRAVNSSQGQQMMKKARGMYSQYR